MTKIRLAALVSHPIQYMVPLYQRLARHPDVDLTVFYMTDVGIRPTNLAVIGEAIVWDLPLLEGYKHEFLQNRSPVPNQYRVVSKINPGIVPALVNGRFDALYLHGYASVTEWVAYATAKSLRIPVVFHGDTALVSETERPRLARQVFRRAFCRGIDAALVMSTRARLFYEENGVPEDRMFWAPLSVDNQRFFDRASELASQKRALKEKLGLDPDLPLVMSVVNFRPSKRPMDLVNALERMKTKASMVIVGNGPLHAEVAVYCRDKGLAQVALPGNRNQSQLPEYYAAGDVFALPSSYDLNPLVVREAMCFSLPVVLSDGVQSSIDFLRTGENGFGYAKGDVEALAVCLDRVLSDEDSRVQMGIASRKLIEPWNYKVAVDGIVRGVKSTLRRRGGS